MRLQLSVEGMEEMKQNKVLPASTQEPTDHGKRQLSWLVSVVVLSRFHVASNKLDWIVLFTCVVFTHWCL